MGGLRGSWPIFRIGGIPVRIHWSLLLVLPYLAVVFGAQFRVVARLAEVPPEHLVLSPYLWGLAVAVALFACVLLHELSHIAVGLRTGAEVHDVTLMMLGGVTNMTRMPQTPLSEALMALAGPVSSGLLAAICLLGYRALPKGAPDLRFGIFYLGEINLALAVFNLLPAFPMDGGRVLRALLQPRLGKVRATRVAALVGRVLAVPLGALGFYTGNYVLVLIAVFIFMGAQGEARQAETDDLVRQFRVEQVMDRFPPTLDPAASIGEVADRARATGTPQLFVVDRDGGLRGTVLAERALRAGQARERSVDEILEPAEPVASPDDPLEDALRTLARSGRPRLAVVRAGKLLGCLGPGVIEGLWRGRLLERSVGSLQRREV